MASAWKPIVMTNRQSAAAVFAAGVLAGAVGYFTIDRRDVAAVGWRAVRGTQLEPDVIRWHLAGSKDPVLWSLAAGDIRAGDPVDAVVAAHGPFHVEQFGPYTLLTDARLAGGFSFEGYAIVAKHGRARASWWYTCVGGLTFFDALTPTEAVEFPALRDADRDRRHQDRRAVSMAAIGPVGYIALCEPPLPPDEP